jgi:hypothetical protein
MMPASAKSAEIGSDRILGAAHRKRVPAIVAD